MLANVTAVFPLSVDEVIWNIPFCTIGHMIAQYQKANGKKNVKRQIGERGRTELEKLRIIQEYIMNKIQPTGV